MPFFHGKSEDERRQDATAKQQLLEQQAEQQASLEELAQGGIPLHAQRRLDDLRQREGKFFTSDLSVNEFLLAREAGLRPLSQVMGSSVYHVGWQVLPGQYSYYSTSRELSVLTQAMNQARLNALGRLSEEAQRVGADAVIGVHVARGRYDWASDLLEFSTVGTAVRVEGASGAARPALTNLSGQDFWKLFRSGYWPTGVVAASTVYYVVAGWQTQMANNSMWGSWANMELQDFTRGLYSARHIAMSQIREQAMSLGGAGVVGMQIEQSEEEHEVRLGNDQERTDMIFTFHTIGTAIAEIPGFTTVPPLQQVIDLRS
jgi:uncharacterized protein YbjQ (UPF0145 family)